MAKKSGKRKTRKANQRARVRAKSREIARLKDERGRSVPRVPEAFENIASSPERVEQALFAAHNERMIATPYLPVALRLEALTVISALPSMDIVLSRFVQDRRGLPSATGSSWVEHLHWALDSAVSVVRLLLSGQQVGASVVARSQLERWTANRAHLARVSKSSGESDADYVARVWTSSIDAEAVKETPSIGEVFIGDHLAPEENSGFDHGHVILNDGRELCPAVLWGELSEILHGRGLVEAVKWEINDRLDPDDVPREAHYVSMLVADAAALCMAHVRRVLESMCLEAGWTEGARIVREAQDSVSIGTSNEVVKIRAIRTHAIPESVSSPAIPTYMPLTPNEGLHANFTSHVRGEALIYGALIKGEKRAVRRITDDELLSLAFGAHRYKSVVAAQYGLEQERKKLGASFDRNSIGGRSASMTLVAEALSLVSTWTSQPEISAASATASSSLRSAYWLWLEDDDRAMAQVRTVLEQLARMRVWRLKPKRAAQLEARGAPPSRWLEGAGWKRLGPLNHALGQFAHMDGRTDWESARELLTAMQVDVDPDHAATTARRSAFELTQELAAREALALLRPVAPATESALATLLARHGLRVSEIEPSIEKHFNYIWQHNVKNS